MSPEDFQILINDLHLAQAHGGALFKVKTDYLCRLPWLFVGLAHTDEDTARSIGVQCVSQWEIDPRESVHHVITWDLMRTGSEFLFDLKRFIGGEARRSLGRRFRLEVAKWRFASLSETCIERPHAIVSRMKGWGHRTPSPAEISLANRFPVLDRWLAQGQFELFPLRAR